MSGFWDRNGKKPPFPVMDWTKAFRAQSDDVIKKAEAEMNQVATPISLPKHLYIPERAQSLDIRRARVMDPMTSIDLITFRPVDLGITGSTVIFTAYGVFNDGLVEDDYSFLPTVNGQRIFPYHGNPMKNFLISLGLAPDLSNVSMIECQLSLNPTDTLNWRVTNNSAVATAMGVRMKGYIDLTQARVERRFGG